MKMAIRNPFLLLSLSFCLASAGAHAALTGVDVTAASSVAGTASIHTIDFTTTLTVPSDGLIVISYPAGFDVSGAILASSTTMDGNFSVSTAAQDVVITRSGGTDAAAGLQRLQIANIVNHTAVGTSYSITVTTQNSGAGDIESGADAGFTVTHSVIDHFSVAGMGASEVAGGSFNLTVTAQDRYDNTVSAFTDAADLTDLTGTLAPTQTASFTAGQWTGTVSVLKTHAANTISVNYNGKAGTSPAFTVAPAALVGFEFDAIASPQTAGTWIPVAITAKDIHGNVKTDFVGTVDLSESTGTLSVQSTGTQSTDAFASGGWSGSVQITSTASDLQVTATGSGQNGTSGFFNVVAGAVDHFVASAVGDQNAGTPFLFTVTAQDAHNNTATGFAGTVNLTDLTGTLSPSVSGAFSNGVWTGNLIITQTRTANSISVDDGSGHVGSSNAFNVVTSAVDYFEISAIPSTQTAGTGFSVTIRAMDANANVVTGENGTVNLSDESGSVSPSQITFASGVWTGTVTVSRSGAGNHLTVNGLGESSASNAFAVVHAGLDHFDIASISSPQTAGMGFSMDLQAKDAYGNIVTSFASRVPMSVSSGTLSSALSGYFVNGELTQPVTITQANKDLAITVDDGSGHSGISNRFNVEAGALNRFAVSTVADQATGEPFSITITAQDAYGNTVPQFSGSGNTVTLDHTGAGEMTPATSDEIGDFIQGVWTGNVVIKQTQSGDRIQIENVNGSETGESNTFSVTAVSIDYFDLAQISVDQQAGVPFPVTITVKDSSDNTVITDMAATLIDITGTVEPKVINLTAGTWSGNLTVTRAMANNAVTVTALGKSGTSNDFDVAPGPVHHFEYGVFGSPQTAGVGFNVTVTALDQWDNRATGFTGTVDFTEATGTVSPAVSGNFIAGRLTATLTITQAQSNLRLEADDGSGHTGQSHYFNVQAGGVSNFAVDISGNQIAGDPFTLSVTALDTDGNTATSFTGTVDITDLTGTLQPATSGNFVDGRWTGNVTVFQAMAQNVITVTRSGGTESGQSVPFDLAEPPGIRVIETQVSQSTVTAGQTQDWTVKMAVRNLSSYPATLQQVDLDFDRAGQAQTDYAIAVPTAFLISGTNLLAGGATDTVQVTVTQTGSGLGDVYIGGTVSCLDSNTGRTIPALGSSGVVVQRAAELDIFRLVTSQDSATVGQDSLWTVDLIVQNTGEATLKIDSSAVDNALSFTIGSNWHVLRPDSLNGGGWLLTGGASDTLHFIVDHSGDDETGVCTVGAALQAVELNTGAALSDDTQDHGAYEIFMEDNANFSVVGMQSLAPNDAFVNVQQSFVIRVYVENEQTTFPVDGAHQVTVSLSSNGTSYYPQGPNGTIAHLPGGAIDSVDIQVNAAPSARSERFVATVQGVEDNTKRLVQGLQSADSFQDMTIQNPAELHISQIILSKNQIVAAQVDPWTIDVVLFNAGSSSIVFDAFSASQIGFFANGIRQEDYIIQAPTALNHSGMILPGNSLDTLRYTVTATGRLGGAIDVQPSISGVDANDLTGVQPETVQPARVQVEAETEFRIIQSYVLTPHRNEAGNGFVDTEQTFQVVVKVENGLGETIRDVLVDLTGAGASQIMQSRQSIALMAPSEVDSVIFNITAPSAANSSGDRFTAVIGGGVLVTSGGLAPRGPALDATATAYVQTPAALALTIELSPPAGQFSEGQVFTFSAALSNEGEGEVNTGSAARIVLPEGYTLEANQSQTLPVLVGEKVSWSVRAPQSHHSPPRTAYVILEPIPLALNTETPAAMAMPTVSVDLQTVETALSADLLIDSPLGAVDGILSTAQSFVLRLAVSKQNVQEVSATLSLPAGYSSTDNFIKSVNGQDVLWHILAPGSAAQSRNIQVTIEGKDVFQPDVTVTGQGDLISVTTVERTALSLALETSDHSVSLGQIFTVTATLSNLGTAQTTGSAAVTLNPLPAGYLTADPATKILENGQASWAIKAPVQPTQEAVNIVASLSAVPLDENTSEAAFVAQAQDKVAMTTVGAWLSIGLLSRPENLDGLVTSSEYGVWAAAYEFINRGETGANGILFNALQFHLEDEQAQELEPADLFSEVRLLGMKKVKGVWLPDENQIYGRLESSQLGANPLRIAFSQRLMLSAQDTIRLALIADMAQSVESQRFAVTVRNQASVDVEDEYSPGIRILVYDMTGAEFESLTGFTQQVVAQSSENADEPTLIPCPNPFGMADKEKTYLVYYLPEDTEVTFRVFTLTGELVWSAQYAAGTPQGSAGLHGQGADEVTWDGRNDMGERVLSGVYVCYMETGQGKRKYTKIAVIY